MEIETILGTTFLKHLPVHFRYMKCLPTGQIDELYHDTRFSDSVQHHSSNYIVYTPYKPIDAIVIDELAAYVKEYKI